jgi:hypothetical protein
MVAKTLLTEVLLFYVSRLISGLNQFILPIQVQAV